MGEEPPFAFAALESVSPRLFESALSTFRRVTSSREPLSLTGRGATCLLSKGLAGLEGWLEWRFSGVEVGERSSGDEELSLLGAAVLGEEGDRVALMAHTG